MASSAAVEQQPMRRSRLGRGVPADVHVLDFWVGIAAGCSIVMAPSQQLKDVDAVAALIQQHSVVSTSFVPSICQPLLEACGGKPLLSSLRHVSVGGEAVRPAAVSAMLAAAPSAAIYNIYGAQQVVSVCRSTRLFYRVAVQTKVTNSASVASFAGFVPTCRPY
jgi:non-ribosomal peptide synthetase component F